MNRIDVARWLAGHRKPSPARVVAVVGGKETPLQIRGGTGRWARAAGLLEELGAESVRLYDGDDKLIDAAELEELDGGDDVAPSSPASSSKAPAGYMSSADVVHMFAAFTDNMKSMVKEITSAQAGAHAAAFKELRAVAEIATNRLTSLEMFVQHSFAERAAQLEQREEQQRTEEEQSAEGTLDKVMEKIGPQLAEKFTTKLLEGKKKNGAGAAKSDGATNGATHTNGATNGSGRKKE